jgi:hypothetical protein
MFNQLERITHNFLPFVKICNAIQLGIQLSIFFLGNVFPFSYFRHRIQNCFYLGKFLESFRPTASIFTKHVLRSRFFFTWLSCHDPPPIFVKNSGNVNLNKNKLSLRGQKQFRTFRLCRQSVKI